MTCLQYISVTFCGGKRHCFAVGTVPAGFLKLKFRIEATKGVHDAAEEQGILNLAAIVIYRDLAESATNNC